MSVIESQLVVGRYQLEHVIGAGGFADVYRARTVRGQVRRDVAVKILRPAPSMDRAGREISAQRQIHHPNVIPILDHGIVDDGPFAGRAWIAMPLAAHSLESRLQRGCLSDGEATELAIAMIDALDAAHRHHVLHRDIKPDNILRYRDRWVLADFGIAATVEATNDHHMTVLAGSMGYMAPEMWFSGAVSSAADVYALGVTLHRALTGEIPEPLQPGETWADRASRLLYTTPRCASTLPEGWRPFVEAACAPVGRRARTRDLLGARGANGAATAPPSITISRIPGPPRHQPTATAARVAVPAPAWQPAPAPSPAAARAPRRRRSATRRGALVVACVAAGLGVAAAASITPTRVALAAVSASGLLLAITLFLLLRSLLRRGHFLVRLCWRGALSVFAATCAAYLLYPTGALGSVVDRRTARSITNVGVPLLPPAGDGALVDLSDVVAGDCVLAPAAGLGATALQRTPCTHPHNFEVTGVLDMSSTSPPTVCERPPGRGTSRPRVVLRHSTRDNVVQHPYAVCVAFVPGRDGDPLAVEHRFADVL